MKKIFLYFLLVLTCVHSPLLGKTDPPNPLDLQSEWFKYFEGTDTELKTKVEQVSSRLKEITEESPSEAKESLTPVKERIISNLNAFLLARTQPEESTPPDSPLQEKYTVDDLIRLDRSIRNRSIILETDKEDFEQRKKQILAVQDKLLNLRNSYQTLPPRSQEKLLSGLNIIDLRIALELAREKQVRLEQSMKIDRKVIERDKKELAIAKERVESNQAEVTKVKQEQIVAEQNWQRETQQLREAEAASISSFDFSQRGERAKLANQLLTQRVTKAQIQEALALNSYLMSNLKLALIRYLTDSDTYSAENLSNDLGQWREELDQLKKNAIDWELEIKNDIQRAEEWLSLNVDVEDSSSRRIRDLQEQVLNLAEESLVEVIKLTTEIADTNFLFQILNQIEQGFRSGFENAFYNVWVFIKKTFSSITGSLDEPLFSIGEEVVDPGDILKFFFILAGTFWASRFVRTAIDRFAIERKGVKLALLYRVNRLFSYLIIAIGILIALSSIGFNFSNLVLIASALGVGLGFGLQTLFNNFVSGLVILFENQLKVGDYIELESGICGEVKEINVRSTYIKTNDGIAIMIPNSELTTTKVINWTHTEPYRRVQIFFSVHYESDKDLVKKVVKEAVAEVPLTLKKSWVPEPRVFFYRMGDHGLEFRAMVWVNEQATKRAAYTKSAYLWAIHDALVANGIEIPYPQMDVHFDSFKES